MEGKKTDKRVYADKMETSKAKRAKTEGFPTDDNISRLSLSLPNDWKNLGTKLGLPYERLEGINQNQGSVEEKAKDMLMKWRKIFKKPNRDAHKTLFDALENIERMDLAAQVTDMYQRFQRQNGTQETAGAVGMSSDHAASGSSSSMEIEIQETDKPGFPTDDDIGILSLSLPNDWNNLGTKLGLPYERLEGINRNQGSVEEKAKDMLMKWRKIFKKPNRDAHKTLFDALENIERMDLAAHVTAMFKRFVRSQPSIKTGTQETAEPVDHAASGSSSSMEIEIQETEKPGFPTDDDIGILSLSLPNDWKHLGTKLGLPYERLEGINRNQGSVEEKAKDMLMKWRKIFKKPNRDAHKTLFDALENIERMDLAAQVTAMYKRFVRSQPSIKTGTQETAEPVDSSDDTSGQDPSPPYSEYPINRNPRGLCVIINNEKFIDGTADRTGSNIDEGKLEGLFEKLHFKVQLQKNQKADEMRKVFKDVSKMDHSEYDCFACCIMSHGRLGEIQGVNGQFVKTQDILEYFKDVKGLNSKPKLFFIQACQGGERQDAARADEASTEAPGLGSQAGLVETVPREADFLLGYATVTGYVAYRNDFGSYYMCDLVDEMEELHSHKDLLTILTAVNNRLSKRKVTEVGSSKPRYQAGLICSTLRKSVYLRDLST